MPKRTNEFQELVAMIQRALAPKGAKITESALVEVPGLKTLREVDILIEGPFGPFEIKVAVEAKDERRKFSLQAFDSLLAKYRGECRVQVDKLVIVTRRGFTEGVVEKATKVGGVELLTLTEATEKDWSKEGPGQIHFRFPPHVCAIAVEPQIDGVSSKMLMEKAHLICSCCQGDVEPLLAHVQKRIFQQFLPSNPDWILKIEEEAANAPSGQASRVLGWDICQHHRMLRIDNDVHSVSQVKVQIHVVNSVGTLKGCEYGLSSIGGGTQRLTLLEGEAGGKNFRFVLPDLRTTNPLIMRIDSADQGKRPKIRRNEKCPCGSGKKFKNCCVKAHPKPT